MHLTLISAPEDQWEILYGDNQKLKEAKTIERSVLIRSKISGELITVKSIECRTLTKAAWEKWNNTYPDTLDSFSSTDFMEIN